MTALVTVHPKTPRDLKRFGRKLKSFARRQLAFAVSKAINDTLFDVRRSSVDLYNASFEVRNRRFIRSALRVKKASKRNLVGHLRDRFEKDWLERQAQGGTKTPRGSKLLVPVAAKRYAKGTKDPRSYAKSFIGKTRDGRLGLFQRYGRGGKRMRMLFALKDSVRVPKRFPFYANAKKTTRRLFDDHFAKAWRYALQTARL